MKKNISYICLTLLALVMYLPVSAQRSKTITINSSCIHPLYFPGELSKLTISGSTDRHDYNNSPASYGLDYVVMVYDYPRFNYLQNPESLPAGAYCVQFVDNYAGLSATLSFNGGEAVEQEEPTDEKPYAFVGNAKSTVQRVDGYILKYDNAKMKFMLVKDAIVSGYEAYFVTSKSFPASQIVITDNPTGIKRVFASDGGRMSVKPVAEGIVMYAEKDAVQPIYSVSGQLVKSVSLRAGSNAIGLPKGLYVVGNEKVVVR